MHGTEVTPRWPLFPTPPFSRLSLARAGPYSPLRYASTVSERASPRGDSRVSFAPVAPDVEHELDDESDYSFTGVHFFAGKQRHADSISGHAHILGGCVADVDIGTGGAGHDLRRPTVLGRWRRRLQRGTTDCTWLGGPCATFSPRHEPQLRTVWEPEGMLFMPHEWSAHVAHANALWEATALLARDQFDAGGEFVVEFPQRRYVRGKRAFWGEMADRGVASPGDLPCMLALERDTEAVRVDISQCAWGSCFQKFTTLLCSPRMAARLSHMGQRGCPLCDRYAPHEERATGTFADGSSRAEASGTYPSEMCYELAVGAADCPRVARRAAPRAILLPDPGAAADGPLGGAVGDDTPTEPVTDAPPSPPPSPPSSDDGLSDSLPDPEDTVVPDSHVRPVQATGFLTGIAAGPELPSDVRARVEAARTSPPRHASLRNLNHATRAELRRSVMPHLPAVRSERQPAPTPAAWGEDRVGPQGQRPAGRVAIAQLFRPGVFERIEEWRIRAETAMLDIAAGKPARPPATLTIPQSELQPWARGLVWDTRDPLDCRHVAVSTEETPPVSERTLDREQIRLTAEKLDWPDRDLVGQCTGGGIESRSECSGDTVLAFHHTGIVEYFAAADKAIQVDVAAGSVLSGYLTLPFVPCRSLPRNVILQQRSRVLDNGEVEDYEKPRVTTNSSHGEGEVGGDGISPLAVNEGVPAEQRYVLLPTVRQLGRGAAMVGEAGAEGGLRAELYCFDLSSAYRFAQLQLRDWWQHVFLWLLPDQGLAPRRRAVWIIDAHGAFGGAYMPQRFEGITNLGIAAARDEQDAFDAANPYPPEVRAWQAERLALQRDGALPPGPEQTRPAYLQVYLDDGAGAALNDTVPVPPALAHIPLGELATRTLGGTPSAHDSRAAVHLRIAVATFERLGFVVEVTKTECGSAIVNLGFRVRIDAGRIDCPLPKRRIMLRDIHALRLTVDEGAKVEQRGVERLVGRIANLSHVLPEAAPHLAGGYAIASARRVPAGRRRANGYRLLTVRLRRGGRCEAAVLSMCEVTTQLLESNEGIALASAEHFVALGSTGTLTTVTDASGEDGIGGYAFHPSAPGVVWIMADAWPDDVLAALAHAAAPRAERVATRGVAACSMPLAELFGPWAMAAAVADGADTDGGRPWPTFRAEAVISVVDCAPAAAVLTAATSGGAQLRSLVIAARSETRCWLAAAVPREWNCDADILSHPSRWLEVRTAAESAGLSVRRVQAPIRCWTALREAMMLPMGREAASWRESGEVGLSTRAATRPGQTQDDASASAERPSERPRSSGAPA